MTVATIKVLLSHLFRIRSLIVSVVGCKSIHKISRMFSYSLSFVQEKHNIFGAKCQGFFTLCSATQLSVCFVKGNISYGVHSIALYPCPVKYFKSRARVSGFQDTYTTRFGASFTTEERNASSLPALGGSINTTSTFAPCSAIPTITSPASAL